MCLLDGFGERVVLIELWCEKSIGFIGYFGFLDRFFGVDLCVVSLLKLKF